jgi:hypothetical protein
MTNNNGFPMTTSSPMDHLQGVDNAWALDYINKARKLEKFMELFPFFPLSPRAIKMVILKPNLFLRVIHKAEVKRGLDGAVNDPTETIEGFKFWEETPLRIDSIEKAIGYFNKHLSPTETLIKCESEVEDGEENFNPINAGSSVTLLEPLMVIAVAALIIIGSISICFR